MLLLRENRRWIRKSIDWTAILEISLGIFFYLGIAADSPAQIPAPPPAKTEPTAKIDPLERETPRRAVIGFLKYSERQDFANAARYLQPTPGQDTNLVQRAKELQALHSRFRGDIGLLSDDPNGTVEVGLPPGQVRAGVLALGGTTTDVLLVRVDEVLGFIVAAVLHVLPFVGILLARFGIYSLKLSQASGGWTECFSAK